MNRSSLRLDGVFRRIGSVSDFSLVTRKNKIAQSSKLLSIHKGAGKEEDQPGKEGYSVNRMGMGIQRLVPG